MGDNNKEEVERKKKCPFLNARCIEGACKFWMQVTETKVGQLGLAEQVKVETCSFIALCLIMSSGKLPQPAIQNKPFPFIKG